MLYDVNYIVDICKQMITIIILLTTKGIKKMFRRFGIEIEVVNTNRQKLVTAMREQGLSCEYEGYNHRTTSHWKIVTDASVRGGYELVSPILEGEEGLLAIKKATKAISASKRNSDMDQVNRSCGIHVHIEAKNLSSKDMYFVIKRYQDNESMIDSWMPISRRANTNSMCGSIASTFNAQRLARLEAMEDTYEDLANAILNCSHTRYSKVNVQSYGRYKTIEFRQHSGTTDYNKIANWIEFLQNFVEQSSKLKSNSLKVSPTYKPRKSSAMFASIREQVASLGGKLFYRGSWFIVDENGTTNRLTRPERLDGTVEEKRGDRIGYTTLANLYENQNGKGKINPARFQEFMMTYFARTLSSQDNDNSLMAGQPEYVKEFFEMRATQLRRA